MTASFRPTLSFFRLLTLFVLVFVTRTASAISVGNRVALRVTDLASSSPVEFAAVTFSSADSNEVKGGYTDSEGQINVSVPSGKWAVEVSMVGFMPLRRMIEINGDLRLNLALDSEVSLSEVVVTAREAHSATSASLIDTTAMRHLQPSSFSDLMALS